MIPKRLLVALALAATLVAGCSKSPAIAVPAAANAHPTVAETARDGAVANAAEGGAPTPCETDFSARDAAEILTGSTALNRYSMSAALGEPENGCEMGDENALIDFSIRTRPQLTRGGNQALFESETKYGKGVHACAGVGDRCAWFDVTDSNIPGRSEFRTIALKGEMLCMVELHFKQGPQGDKAITPARGEELAKKLGMLCNKSFAVRGG